MDAPPETSNSRRRDTMSRKYTREQKAIGVGMAIAAGIVMSAWGNEVAAEEILGAAGLRTVKDMRESGVEWYDIRLCVPVLRTFRNRDRANLESPQP